MIRDDFVLLVRKLWAYQLFSVEMTKWKFTLKAIFGVWRWVVDEVRGEYAPVSASQSIYSSRRLWHRPRARLALCPRITMDVRAIGNELQFVNGGKFERVLDFRPTIMKSERITRNMLKNSFSPCKIMIICG